MKWWLFTRFLLFEDREEALLLKAFVRFNQFIDTRIFTAQCHFIENPAGEKNVAVAVLAQKV